MALGGTDVLKLIIDADSKGAVSEFDKLGKSIKSSVGDAETKLTGFKGKLASAFDGLQSHSSAASGLFQKLGVSSEQAAGAISASIPAAGVAAAGALVAFAAKGVKAFQEVALASGKFAAATGLSVESASRYIAVADDIGVSAGTIQNAFVKMEKALQTNRAAFADFIAIGKNGSVDLDKTFLNVITHIQGIKDPIERANESSKLFGKGFAEVAQIIGTDAETLKAKLGSVSDAQVITDAELQKAREYQAAMDNLKDSVRDLSIQLGQALVPALSNTANTMASLINGAQRANKSSGGLLGDLAKSFMDTINPIQGFQDAWKKSMDLFGGGGGGGGSVAQAFDAIATSASKMGTAIGPASTSVGDFVRSAQPAADINLQFGGSADAVAQNLGHESDALSAANDALAAHTNALLAAAGSALGVSEAQRAFTASVEAATAASQSGTATSSEMSAAYDRETQTALTAAQAAVTYAQKQAEAQGKTLSAKQANDILISTLQQMASQASGPTAAALNTLIGKLQETGRQNPRPSVSVQDNASAPLASIKGKVDGLDGARASIHVTADTSAARSAVNGIIAGFNRLPGTHIAPIATGTKNFAGGLALVGERGPELVMLPSGTMVKNAAETKAIMDGPSALSMSTVNNTGGSINIIFSGLVTDEIAVGREIKRVLARAGYSGVN